MDESDDYTAPGHRLGCSGIDGTTFAPIPGSKDGKKEPTHSEEEGFGTNVRVYKLDTESEILFTEA